PGAGALRLRRLRPPPLAGGSELPEADGRAVPRDAVRAAALLPVRPRGRLARARLRQRLLRPLADDPARGAAGGGARGGARAGAALEAALRLRRRADAGAVPRGRDMVARRARRRAAGAAAPRRGGGCGTDDPSRERADAVRR